MTIDQLVSSLRDAYTAYTTAPTQRTKKARYQRMLAASIALKDRLDEAVDWMDWMGTGTPQHAGDNAYIDVLRKYERGYTALGEARTWL